MRRRKMWKCDFKGCDEVAQWYRVRKGHLVKICTTHEAKLAKEHWGRRVDYSKLSDDDIAYLIEKDEEGL